MKWYLSQEVDPSPDDEGGYGRPDDGEQGDGADVLEEVSLKTE